MDPEQTLHSLHSDLHLHPSAFNAFKALIEHSIAAKLGKHWRLKPLHERSFIADTIALLHDFGKTLWPSAVEKRGHLMPSSQKSEEGYWAWDTRTAGFEVPVALVDGRMLSVSRVGGPRRASTIFLAHHRRVFAAEFPQLTPLQVTQMLTEGWRTAGPEERARFYALADEEKACHGRGGKLYQQAPVGGMASKSKLGWVVKEYMEMLRRCSAGVRGEGVEGLVVEILGCTGGDEGLGLQQSGTAAHGGSESTTGMDRATMGGAAVSTPDASETEGIESTLLSALNQECFLDWCKAATGGMGGLPIMKPGDVQKMVGWEAENPN